MREVVASHQESVRAQHAQLVAPLEAGLRRIETLLSLDVLPDDIVQGSGLEPGAIEESLKDTTTEVSSPSPMRSQVGMTSPLLPGAVSGPSAAADLVFPEPDCATHATSSVNDQPIVMSSDNEDAGEEGVLSPSSAHLIRLFDGDTPNERLRKCASMKSSATFDEEAFRHADAPGGAWRPRESLRDQLAEGTLSRAQARQHMSRMNTLPFLEKPKKARLSLGRMVKIHSNDTLGSRLAELAQNTERRRVQGLLLKIVKWVDWWDSIVEPERSGWAADVVSSRAFEFICMTVILLNGVFTSIATEEEIKSLAGVAPLHMTLIECAFLAFYIVELTLKVIVHRVYFFCNEDMKWNILDLCLVLISAGDVTVTILTRVHADSKGWGPDVNVSFLRQFRFFKMAKILRMFRVLQFFTDLRLMLDCVLGSFFALFWCIVMIVFVQYVFGLFLMQGLTEYLVVNAGSVSSFHKEQIYKHFNSVPRTVLSLFQTVTGGIDWYELHDTINPAGMVMTGTFLFYIAFFVVAAWNVITSTYVHKALKLAQPDIDSLMLEKQKKDQADAKELVRLFSEMDLDDSGMISMSEFMSVVHSARFGSFLEVRGIDIKDAEMFYSMVASLANARTGDEVDISILVNGCLRMKGLATSIDLHTIGFESRAAQVQSARYFEEIMRRMTRMEVQQRLNGQRSSVPAG